MASTTCPKCQGEFDTVVDRLRHQRLEPHCDTTITAPAATVTVVSDVQPTMNVTAVAPPKDLAIVSGGTAHVVPVTSVTPAEDLIKEVEAAGYNVPGKGLHHKNTWSPYGQYIFDYVLRHKGDVINAVGHHGLGKTNLLKSIAAYLGMDFVTINCHQGMDIAWLIGMPAPTNIVNGVGLVWVDGELTRAVRGGLMIVMEEFNMMPPEMLTRLHGVLDQSHPSHVLPEASGLTDAYVPIHPDFWFVASMNPVESGYDGSQLSKPMLDRLTYQIPVNQPLGDEAAILKEYFPEDTITYNANHKQVVVEHAYWHAAWERFITDARPKLIDWPSTGEGAHHLPHQEKRAVEGAYLSTRTLIDMAVAIKKGDTPTEVAVIVVADKYPNSPGIAHAFISQFGRGVKKEVVTDGSTNTATTSES